MSTKRKFPAKIAHPMVKQSAKPVGKLHLDESRTVVTDGGDAVKRNANGIQVVVDISSDSESDDEEDSQDEESASEADDVADTAPEDGGDVAMDDADADRNTPLTRDLPLPEDAEEETGEPSFGDLLQANASEPIDVAGAFNDPSSHALSYPQRKQIQPPSGASLGTVLTQALKTNDVSLLESCLQTMDVNTIRATIQRLDSPLAGLLLHKLAERLHKRPGRAGSLMVWVQWTLVTHGGYLATQPDLIKKLAALNRVIDERLKGLQTLLSLKGKLDMLEAQIQLRRNMQSQGRSLDDEEDEEGVIYVEGQESDEEDVAVNKKSERLANDGNLEDFSEGEESEDMSMTNGMIADSEEEEESEEDGLIDDEAEESDAETSEEDEVDHNDQDSQGDSESDDGIQAPPPSKMQRIEATVSGKR